MSNSQITFRAIAPIYSPLSLHLGVDQFAASFIESLKGINVDFVTELDQTQTPLNWQGKLLYLGGQQNEKRQYQSTDQNSKDVRLMCWTPASSDTDSGNVMFHVFTNHIAIAEVELAIDIKELTRPGDSVDVLVKLIEEQVQQLAQAKIDIHLNNFYQDLQQLKPLLSDDFCLV